MKIRNCFIFDNDTIAVDKTIIISNTKNYLHIHVCDVNYDKRNLKAFVSIHQTNFIKNTILEEPVLKFPLEVFSTEERIFTLPIENVFYVFKKPQAIVNHSQQFKGTCLVHSLKIHSDTLFNFKRTRNPYCIKVVEGERINSYDTIGNIFIEKMNVNKPLIPVSKLCLIENYFSEEYENITLFMYHLFYETGNYVYSTFVPEKYKRKNVTDEEVLKNADFYMISDPYFLLFSLTEDKYLPEEYRQLSLEIFNMFMDRLPVLNTFTNMYQKSKDDFRHFEYFMKNRLFLKLLKLFERAQRIFRITDLELLCHFNLKLEKLMDFVLNSKFDAPYQEKTFKIMQLFV